MIKRKGILLICMVMFLGTVVSAQNFKYIGADKCKLCHNKPATGEQYKKWMEEPHSRALESLSNQASLDYAKKNGIADPAKEQKCLKCHSTFHSVDAKLRATITATEGVSCETCHGPGSSYKTPAIMKNQAMAIKMGLIIPDKELCLTCHNKENPFYKEFNYETALAKVMHPNPAAKK
jgi:hypothetical protein